jgi:hypothetical protein
MPELHVRDNPWGNENFRRSLRDSELDYLIDVFDDDHRVALARASLSPEAWVHVNLLVAPAANWLKPARSSEDVAQRQAVREAFMAYAQARIREQLSAGTGEIDIKVTSANQAVLEGFAAAAREGQQS